MSIRVVVCALISVLAVLYVFTAFHASAAPEPTSPRVELGRWQIHRAEMATSMGKDEAKTRSAVNTILLDCATGDTWLLWPTEGEDGQRQYSWITIPKRD